MLKRIIANKLRYLVALMLLDKNRDITHITIGINAPQ